MKKITSGSRTGIFVIPMADGIVYRLNDDKKGEVRSSDPERNCKIGRMHVAVSDAGGTKCLVLKSDSQSSSHKLDVVMSSSANETVNAFFKGKNGVVTADIPAGTKKFTVEYSASDGLSLSYDDSLTEKTSSCTGSVPQDLSSGDNDMIKKLKEDIARIEPEETSRLELLNTYYENGLDKVTGRINALRSEVKSRKKRITDYNTECDRLEKENDELRTGLERAASEYEKKKAENTSLKDQIDSLKAKIRIDKDAVSCLNAPSSDSKTNSEIREVTDLIFKAENLLNQIISLRQTEINNTAVKE